MRLDRRIVGLACDRLVNVVGLRGLSGRLGLRFGRRRCFCSGSGRGVLDGQQRVADFDLRAFVDVHLGDPAGKRTGQFDHGLAGFELHYALFGLDLVPFLDQHVDDVARLDVLAQVRHFEINRHGSRAP